MRRFDSNESSVTPIGNTAPIAAKMMAAVQSNAAVEPSRKGDMSQKAPAAVGTLTEAASTTGRRLSAIRAVTSPSA